MVLIQPIHESWLRSFPLFVAFGRSLSSDRAIRDPDSIPSLDFSFWKRQTEQVESLALRTLSNAEIDAIFDRVSEIVDENLSRFDPMVLYFASHFPDGDPVRIEIEREIALAAKRDLAWMTIEIILEQPGFFSRLKEWYEAGRWPHGWKGEYPRGKIIVT